MAEDQSDSTDKTEEPSHRRLQEALNRGNVAYSREVTNLLMLAVLALNITWFAPLYMQQMLDYMAKFISQADDIRIDEPDSSLVLFDTVMHMGLFLVLPIVASIFAALLSSFMQNGVIFATDPLEPDTKRISIFTGLERMFSLRSIIEFIKGLIKITLVGAVSYIVIETSAESIAALPAYDIMEMLNLLGTLALKIVVGALAVMLVIAMLDFLYQKFEFMKSLRMTRQELKEEFKQSEGDPQIKARLRQLRMERARQRMIASVPKADVVIRNPEHYAVALEYKEATMSAPVVLALGQDNLALKIIEIAELHKIPLVRNPPLARALYGSAELNEEIPLEHYKAVAEVIGYIYRTKGKTKRQV